MNVLVTGGAGYIGSHMLIALQEAGWRVSVFDNLSRGFADAVGDVPIIIGDIRNPKDLESCFLFGKFDLVMHFAALSYVGESVKAPDVYYQNNVVGGLNLLDTMRRHAIKYLVFSSSCATYGEPLKTPIKEDHPQNPINPYGRTKLIFEQALNDYAFSYGLNSVSLRYFNAAGCDPKGRVGERHSPETHLLPLVLAEALRVKYGGNPKDTSLIVFGDDFPTSDGSCIRDYIHVNDLCRAHLLAAKRMLDGKSKGAEFFNLGNGSGFSVLEIINVCRKVTGQPIEYLVGPRRAGDPAVLIGDSQRASTELGWNANFTSLERIIETAWAWSLGNR